MNIGIVGSRDFSDLELVRRVVRELPTNSVIVSGGASGPDSVAVEEAKKLGLKTIIHLAQWSTLGKKAGIIRNRLIVRDSDELIAFWDGQSKGTKHSIDTATKAGKPVDVIFST